MIEGSLLRVLFQRERFGETYEVIYMFTEFDAEKIIKREAPNPEGGMSGNQFSYEMQRWGEHNRERELIINHVADMIARALMDATDGKIVKG